MLVHWVASSVLDTCELRGVRRELFAQDGSDFRVEDIECDSVDARLFCGGFFKGADVEGGYITDVDSDLWVSKMSGGQS